MNCKICGKVRDYGYKIFCRSCYLKERRKKLRGLKWGKPGIEAFKKARNKCERCSSTTRLQIHHIDGKGSTTPTKKQNNKLENLIIVCPKCHYFLHKASGLNRLGRKTLKENGIWATNHSCCVVCKTIKIKHNCKRLIHFLLSLNPSPSVPIIAKLFFCFIFQTSSFKT